MSDDHLLVFNIDRIGDQALKAQKTHDRREGGDLSHTRPSLKAANLTLHGTGDPVADVRTLMEAKGVKVRKDNESPYTRVVLSASPELFNDLTRTKKWAKDSMDFLRETWGDGLAYAVLHMDEKTPHIHAVIVPIVESSRGPISSHHTHPATKGRNSYERLRRAAAKRLGLGYGEPGNKPQTITERAQKDAKAIIGAAHAKAFEALDIIDAERATLAKERATLHRDREALHADRAAFARDRADLSLRAHLIEAEALRLRQPEAARRVAELAPPPPPPPPPEKAKTPPAPPPAPFEFADPPDTRPRPKPRGRDRGEER